ncbi:MAG: CDP-diacylglycerol--glycerol-3-phosphate 3-phosphatidyltransferase [Alphaproteobacteria bacterium]|nr:CDP-diacylglycerol--glycerol-3-phosphate 3-phosphatidyltransferase [Alphaproteobacteria bacterium]
MRGQGAFSDAAARMLCVVFCRLLASRFLPFGFRVMTASSSVPASPNPWWKQIPNALTLFRLIVSPIVAIGLTVWFGTTAQWTLFVLYVLCALSDTLDGNLARILNARSSFGVTMDSIADKVLIVGVAVALVAQGYILGMMVSLVILMVVREMVVAGLRESMAEQGHSHSIAPSVAGKTKAIFQLLCFGAYILVPMFPSLAIVAQALLVVATFVSCYSGMDYITVALRQMRGR